MYKLSGSPGILTPKIAGGLPDISTWASATDYHVLHSSVHRFMAWMATDVGGLPGLLTWKSAGCKCFCFFNLNVYTALKQRGSIMFRVCIIIFLPIVDPFEC